MRKAVFLPSCESVDTSCSPVSARGSSRLPSVAASVSRSVPVHMSSSPQRYGGQAWEGPGASLRSSSAVKTQPELANLNQSGLGSLFRCFGSE